MLIDQITLSGLRIFESVYRLGSMSEAAKELFLTQPGVSQHIKQIELTLNAKLFDRLAKKLIPTSEAKALYSQISPILYQLENSLSEVNRSQRSIKGKISFGMPIEFGNNIILPLLSTWAKANHDVYFHINYDHAQRQLAGLLDGSLDFAITDSFAFPDQIETINLARENLVLCASKEYAKENNLNESSKYKQLKDLDYITYLEDATIVKQWFNFHFEKSIEPNKRVSLMDVQGVSRFIVQGLGVGVLPMHIVREKGLEKDLIIFNGKSQPLYNEINLSTVKGKTMSMACQTFLRDLNESLKLRFGKK
ncbi:LysR family transcriptional regulator [Bacteriovorax sp. Seq25_V]|uniref:LysR family transcriptional regulator n=1 Tax=Bacteriovorax sp. Seq25_V TaxID=1201288 RepID=UPI00038A232B|nr:LysR family transcriptional regulator [Bacteriovorax sp. Seq25_V]EQC45999.1 LysR substrate-binding domain protein [Bacteriovorax sp. Seq25_V]